MASIEEKQHSKQLGSFDCKPVKLLFQAVPEQPDTRDWRSRSQPAAEPGALPTKSPQTEAKAQSVAPQAASQTSQRQKPTAQQQASGAVVKDLVGCCLGFVKKTD